MEKVSTTSIPEKKETVTTTARENAENQEAVKETLESFEKEQEKDDDIITITAFDGEE